MEPYICKLDPEINATLKVYLYKDVNNVEEIRRNITEGCWKCCAVKPSLVVDPLQLAVAANKAVLAERAGNMITRTVFAEMLYNLSISKNISQSLSKFGIEKGKDLLLCFLVIEENDVSEKILNQIEGEAVPISELCELTNLKDVKSVYKLNSTTCDNELLDMIVSRIVTKSFSAH